MRSAARLLLLGPLVALAAGLGMVLLGASTAGAAPGLGILAPLASPTAEPVPQETTAPPVLCPPLCPSESPTADPTTSVPTPTRTATAQPKPTRTPTRTHSPRPQRTSDPNVQLPTGVPAPSDTATEEAATPTPTAAGDRKGGSSDPVLRIVQAAVGLALLLGLLGGIGLYLTRARR